MGVTQADAERLKERFGCAYEPMVDPGEVIQLPSTAAQGERHIPRELLAHIIHQRMDEVFDLVQREITAAGYAGKLSAGVVLTGGAAAMPGSAELASEVFGTGVRVGVPTQNVGGLVDTVEAPRFATVVGLAQYGANRVALGAVTTSARADADREGDGRDHVQAEVLAPGFLLRHWNQYSRIVARWTVGVRGAASNLCHARHGCGKVDGVCLVKIS